MESPVSKVCLVVNLVAKIESKETLFKKDKFSYSYGGNLKHMKNQLIIIFSEHHLFKQLNN